MNAKYGATIGLLGRYLHGILALPPRATPVIGDGGFHGDRRTFGRQAQKLNRAGKRCYTALVLKLSLWTRVKNLLTICSERASVGAKAHGKTGMYWSTWGF